MMTKNADAEKFMVMPFKRGKKGLTRGEVRPAQTEFGAIRTAGNMAPRFDGVMAVAFRVDPDTGDMIEPRELSRHGEVPELQAE